MQVLCACDSVLAMVVLVADAVHVTLVLVRVLTVRVLAVVVPVLVVLVSLVVVAVRVMLVSLVVVLVALMLAMSMLVVAVLMHAMTVLVVAVRVIVLVSQVRLLVPERRHKHLTKSMTQQVAADKHAPGFFLRLIARNRPCALYQVKLDPLITARQRSFCTRKLSKHAS